jgi:putative transcriptional regulator
MATISLIICIWAGGYIMGKIVLTLEQKLEKEKMTRYELAKLTGIQYQTLDGYYKNKVRRYDSDILLKICLTLNCNIEDIITIIRN